MNGDPAFQVTRFLVKTQLELIHHYDYHKIEGLKHSCQCILKSLPTPYFSGGCGNNYRGSHSMRTLFAGRGGACWPAAYDTHPLSLGTCLA